MTVRTQAQLLALIPGTWVSGTNRGPQGMQFVSTALLQDMVDTMFAGVSDAKDSVRLATAGALPAYTRTGAVLLANAVGALGNIDGTAVVVGDRILVKNGVSGVDNGIYVVNSIGAAGSKWQMTRAGDLAIGARAAGIFFMCEEGSTYVDYVFICTTNHSADVVGTNTLAFSLLAAVTDHGTLAGLGDDDHIQYSLVAGTRAFSGVVGGVTPTAAAHLATRGFVDGRDKVVVVHAVTAAALAAYTRTADVITAAAPGALAAVDGITLTAGQLLLLKNGAAGADNGIYEVTTVGDGATAFVLTRDSRLAATSNASGMTVFCAAGAANADRYWACTDAIGADRVNTDALTFAQLPGASLADGSRAFTAVVGGVTPTLAAHLSTRGFVDAKPWKGIVNAVTAAALAAYTRVDDVITANAVGALGAIDGVGVVQGQVILLKNGAAGADNGIYEITTLGDGATAFVLTRAQGLAAGMNAAGAVVFAEAGAANGQRTWVCTDLAAAAVVNTHALTFAPMHGTLATANTHMHDTTQVDDLSMLATATATSALNAIRAKLGTHTLNTTELQTSDGAALSNALYDIDCTAGGLMVGNVPAWFTAKNDVVLVGAGSGAVPCYELNGTPAAVITADSTDKELALVAVLIAGVPTLFGVFGAEAGTGAAVAPTNAEIKAALAAAAIPNHDASCGLIWGRILYARGAGGPGVTTCTHRNVDTYAPLALERAMGNLE